jgi:hypothetical protein
MICRTISSHAVSSIPVRFWFSHPHGCIQMFGSRRWFIDFFLQCNFFHPCAFVSLSSTWMHTNVTMWMIRRTVSSTTLFLHRCGFVIPSSTWMHTNVTPCGWFVELFRPQCCFFIHMDLWSLIHMDAYKCYVHVDDSSFLHPTRYLFIHVRLWFSHAHGCIKCNSMWMFHRTISSTTQCLHPYAFVILTSAWMHTNVKSMQMIRRNISSTTIFRHPCAFVIHLDAYKC